MDEVPASAERRFEFQMEMFQKGAERVQNQIVHLDDILFKIKASAVTVWVAVIGWSMASKTEQLALLGFIVVIGFWLLEAMFKGAQLQYMGLSRRITDALNDAAGLEDQFSRREFDPGLVYPVAAPRTEIEKLRLWLRGIISPTVATIYLFLGFTNVLVWLVQAAYAAGRG